MLTNLGGNLHIQCIAFAGKLNVAIRAATLTFKEIMEKEISERIQSIPSKNMYKFGVDLLNLIEKAHQDDYASFEL